MATVLVGGVSRSALLVLVFLADVAFASPSLAAALESDVEGVSLLQIHGFFLQERDDDDLPLFASVMDDASDIDDAPSDSAEFVDTDGPGQPDFDDVPDPKRYIESSTDAGTDELAGDEVSDQDSDGSRSSADEFDVEASVGDEFIGDSWVGTSKIGCCYMVQPGRRLGSVCCLTTWKTTHANCTKGTAFGKEKGFGDKGCPVTAGQAADWIKQFVKQRKDRISEDTTNKNRLSRFHRLKLPKYAGNEDSPVPVAGGFKKQVAKMTPSASQKKMSKKMWGYVPRNASTIQRSTKKRVHHKRNLKKPTGWWY